MTGLRVIEHVPFSPPALGRDEIDEVVAALESGWLTTGPRVRMFEEAFADYIGAPFAVALGSCTAGLHLSLLASGVGPGDEVITTPLTFCATANAIVHCGATPVFADIDPATGNLDPAEVAAVITPRTRAIVPVHYGGRPADAEAFARLADAHNLAIIDDAAHAVEAVSRGRKIGTTAAFTSFSFYATKNLTTGEGGMVTTASAEAAERLRVLSSHGLSRAAWSRYHELGPVRYELVEPGFKYNMMDLQAAIGLQQLRTIDVRFGRRTVIWRRYDEAFAGLPFTRFAAVPDGDVHARHLYTIQVGEAAGIERDALARRLASQGIATSVHFPAVHLHRYYRERFGFERGRFPHAERLSDTILSLPFSPALTDVQVDRVITSVLEVTGARHAA